MADRIFMETTKISVNKTVGQIQGLLAPEEPFLRKSKRGISNN